MAAMTAIMGVSLESKRLLALMMLLLVCAVLLAAVLLGYAGRKARPQAGRLSRWGAAALAVVLPTTMLLAVGGLVVNRAGHYLETVGDVIGSLSFQPAGAGTVLPLDDVRAVLEAARGHGPAGADGAADAVVVIDEAYGEFRRPGVPSALELLAESDAAGPRHPHLAVARTMSKAFGMAGLRLGYLAASRELVDALRVERLPYHLSALTQAAALAALDHREELMGQVASLRSERDALVAWLRGRGCTAHESDANFVLFGPFEDRDAVFAALLERGVLIRVVGPEGYLRVSIGTPDEMEAFRSALDGVLAGTRPRAPRAAAERP